SRGGDELRDDGPRRPGVRVGATGHRGGGDLHDGDRQGHRRPPGPRLLRLRVRVDGRRWRARVHRHVDEHRPGRLTVATFEPGTELPELRVTPDRYLTNRYAGASGDFNPIHIDEDFARQVGLPGRILH